MTAQPTALTKRIHETHLRLGTRHSWCRECWESEPIEQRPAWLRNLPAKDMTQPTGRTAW